MDSRYIVFDVETPNFKNDRMSALGICIVENMRITDNFYALVNPETYFNRFNIELTGITPEMVARKRSFGELWDAGLADIMCSGVLVAHNAQFDMSVLSKCLDHYGKSGISSLRFACTVKLSRAALPELPNHKLDTVSKFLNIQLDHHHAGSDARAAAEILIYCMKNGCNMTSFIQQYYM